MLPLTPKRSSWDPDEATLTTRIDNLPWNNITEQLNTQGFALVHSLLTAAMCNRAIACYPQSTLFRKRVVMEQHQYGRGEYQYFAYPLPEIVQTLREHLYPKLAPLANQWQSALGGQPSLPTTLAEFLDTCHAAGQTRPTPLLLRYKPGDFNCLHQDLYGDRLFPLQVAILLNEPGRDFTGGEFVLTQQKARTQAQVRVLTLHQGDAVIFAVNRRPVLGQRGTYQVMMKHGVSPLQEGQRHCLGIIFHDAP
jgi:hypothetical protein